MKQVMLDTSFIMSAIRVKIDLFDEIENLGFKIIIPLQVFKELKSISMDKTKKLYFREDAKIALGILEKERSNFEEIDLKTRNVDTGIIKYSKSHSETIIATLDAEIKRRVKNKKLVIRGKKTLDIL